MINEAIRMQVSLNWGMESQIDFDSTKNDQEKTIKNMVLIFQTQTMAHSFNFPELFSSSKY